MRTYIYPRTSLAGLFTLALMLSACNQSNQETSKSTEVKTYNTAAVTFTAEQVKIADISLGKPEMRNLGGVLKLNGKVESRPSAVASVSAPLGGYIKQLNLTPGMSVRCGQALATISSPEFIDLQQEYLESKAQLVYLREEQKRQQTLRQQDINATKTLQKITAEMRVAEARVSGLVQKLRLIGINPLNVSASHIVSAVALPSPISGNIKSVNAAKGRYAAPADVLFEIENTADVWLALNVFEKDLSSLSIGQPVKFALADENDYRRTATVSLIGRSTTVGGTIPVYSSTTDGSKGLVPGSYVKAWVEVESSRQLAVPADAIIQMEGRSYVVSATAQAYGTLVFTFIPVKIGITEGDWTAVEFSQKPPIIVTRGTYAIYSALKNSEEE